MLWVTKKKLRIARAATVWLIRRFIDEQGTFQFVDEDQVSELQERVGAVGFHAKGARYPAQNALGQTAFEALVAEHCSGTRQLLAMGHASCTTPIGRGRRSSRGSCRTADDLGEYPRFAATISRSSRSRSSFYDALYYTLGKRVKASQH